MSDLKDRAEVFWALDAWFDSQDIDLPDRAFLCTQAAGIYLGSHAVPGDTDNLRKGLAILGKVLIKSAVEIYQHLKEHDR